MYSSQIWGQNNSIVNKLQILQNKAMRIIHYKSPRTSAAPLFKSCGILKLIDNVNLQNFMFAYDSLKNNLPLSLCGLSKFVNTTHNTRNEDCFQLDRPRTRTIIYGSRSIKSKSVDIWNSINRSYLENFYEKSRLVCKNTVKKILIDKY